MVEADDLSAERMRSIMTEERERAIASLWEVHRDAPWPKLSGPDEGQLMTLDTVISGCVTYYLDSTEGLDDRRIVILESCLEDLRGLLPDLSDEAGEYFSRLSHLASLLLENPP
jgi:hypothetical protein